MASTQRKLGIGNNRKVVEYAQLRPQILHLELTNACNSRCVFCVYQFQQRKSGLMSEQVFKKAVADYVALGGGEVSLTPVVGDALLHPSFLEWVKYLRRQKEITKIQLITNAIHLDKYDIEEFVGSGISEIGISLASFEERNYEAIYRNPHYQRVKKNVIDLVQANKRRGDKIKISILFRTNRSMAKILRDKDFQEILECDPEVDKIIYFNIDKRINRGTLPKGLQVDTSEVSVTGPCRRIVDGPMVQYDGRTVACGCVASMDGEKYLTTGNIMEQSLLDIYRGDKTENIKKEFLGKKLNPACAGCHWYQSMDWYLEKPQAEAVMANKKKTGR